MQRRTRALLCRARLTWNQAGVHQGRHAHGSTVMLTQHLLDSGTSDRLTDALRQFPQTSHVTTAGQLTMCCGCRHMPGRMYWRCLRFIQRVDRRHVSGHGSQLAQLKWECPCASLRSLFKPLRVHKFVPVVRQRAFLHGTDGVSCAAISMHSPPLSDSKWVRQWTFAGAGQMDS